MKTTNRLLILFIFLILICAQASNTYANVYASQLKISNPDDTPFDGNFSDGTGAKLSFILNDTASVVTVLVKDAITGSVVNQIDNSALSKGLHSVMWDGTGGEAGKQYILEVSAEQANPSNTEWTVFFDSGDIEIFTRGSDVVRDMSSPLFGLIYTPNTGGDAPQEGKGITIYNPDGSFHDPFIVAVDLGDGGTVDWGGGGDAMYAGVFDDEERFYVSAKDFGEVRRLNKDYSITTVITGLTNPKGLYFVGTGTDRVLYICDDSKVVRAAIGDEDIFTGTLEVVGDFSNALPKNVAIDDDGAMYVAFRASNILDSDAKGINKYDISGSLPVIDNDADWFLNESATFGVGDLKFDHGTDPTTSVDDILYFPARGGDDSPADGIWRIPDVNFPFPTVEQIVDEIDLYGEDINIQHRASMAFDAAGNIILMENANEHVFFISPPGESPTNNFTTASPETLTVLTPVSVGEFEDQIVPSSYNLEANYPNPFNPITNIKYVLVKSGQTTLKIYNIMGKEIRTLIDENQSAGEYFTVWDSKDNFGKTVASGVYILTLLSGDYKQSQRMTLLK